MIRRISKNNDLKDIVKSCPIDVIDSIHTLKYYVEGHEDKAIVPSFEKKNNVLVAVLSSQDLKNHPSGILYRKALYSKVDEKYPDHTYDLEMVDCLDVWLGDEMVTPSSTPYLTSDDLKTINGESIVGDGDITVLTPEQEEKLNKIDQKADKSELVDYAKKSDIPSLDGYATESWVEGKGYLTEHQDISNLATKNELSEVEGKIPSLDGYATESWVENKHYLTQHQDLSDYAKKSDIPEVPSLIGYATESWVENKHYLTQHQDLSDYAKKSDIPEVPSLIGYATESWVKNQGYLTQHQSLADYAKKSEIPSLTGYATESWVEGKGYLTEHQDISGLATKNELGEVEGKIPSLDGYATESWVEGKGYLTEHQDISGLATEDYVQEIDGARKEWVINQGYLTEHQDISGKVDKSSIWTGTQTEWDELTDEQKSSYTIALVTE